MLLVMIYRVYCYGKIEDWNLMINRAEENKKKKKTSCTQKKEEEEKYILGKNLFYA